MVWQWVTSDRMIQGPIYGGKDKFNGLGIFFDTYSNSQHDYTFPIITATIGDGKTPYDYAHDGDSNSLGRCEAYYRNKSKPSKACITYIKDSFINVKLQLQDGEWVDCFTISNTTIPTTAYLGFSAMTGEITDNHDLYKVQVITMSAEKLQNIKMAQNYESKLIIDSPVFSFVTFLFKLFILGGVLAALFFGYRIYNNSRNNRF